MTAFGDLLFPFVISCLLFIRGYYPLPAGLEDTGMETMRPLQPDGVSTKALEFPLANDYDYEDHTTSAPIGLSTPRGTFRKCDYNPCLENQIPCTEQAASTGCLCPGFTLHNTIPEKPILRSVSWNGSEVIVSWCAPSSHVTAYVVTVGGQERQKFGGDKRSGAAGKVDDLEEVCVVAMNDAGESGGSCRMYEPRSRSWPLTAGLIGGALGLLVLVLLAVLLWRHKRQRKLEGIISTDNTIEAR
ncbi:leucine-rich repeat neuronal protein 4 [Mugil cephalus]|uniref:leucine-rich repeat neuronal protein 4 n=1 Tax=Mugil cephalus TaxID=48193 RepID=UPI001FB676CF|nr:leucine-rich repeat neuronal protein 4 [Mugil cephalus]XP_047462054.1 leucine-rich repeat neuronal protein 4 [Mugil cephalus]